MAAQLANTRLWPPKLTYLSPRVDIMSHLYSINISISINISSSIHTHRYNTHAYANILILLYKYNIPAALISKAKNSKFKNSIFFGMMAFDGKKNKGFFTNAEKSIFFRITVQFKSISLFLSASTMQFKTTTAMIVPLYTLFRQYYYYYLTKQNHTLKYIVSLIICAIV